MELSRTERSTKKSHYKELWKEDDDVHVHGATAVVMFSRVFLPHEKLRVANVRHHHVGEEDLSNKLDVPGLWWLWDSSSDLLQEVLIE